MKSKAAIGALTLILGAFPFAAAQEREPAERGAMAKESEPVNGQQQTVEMHSVSGDGKGKFLGIIRVENRVDGTLFQPQMEGLPPGLHGFHIHENPNCTASAEEGQGAIGKDMVPAGNAGGHLDPGINGNHAGPYGDGHVGDLPNLFVREDGTAQHPVFAPRVKLMDVKSHALVIHENPDNYTDDPENGGSGARIACGAVP